jgi:hypothetical protein
MKKRRRSPRYRLTQIPIGHDQSIKIYAGSRVSEALGEIVRNLDLYQGVRLTQLLEAAYNQGRKDGARSAFDEIDRRVAEAHRAIPHRLPGRPRNR